MYVLSDSNLKCLSLFVIVQFYQFGQCHSWMIEISFHTDTPESPEVSPTLVIVKRTSTTICLMHDLSGLKALHGEQISRLPQSGG